MPNPGKMTTDCPSITSFPTYKALSDAVSNKQPSRSYLNFSPLALGDQPLHFFPGSLKPPTKMGSIQPSEQKDLVLPPRPPNLPHPEYRTPRGVSPLDSVRAAGLQYPNYTPFKLPNLSIQPFTDRGLSSSPNKQALLSAATEIIHLTPEIGTELTGLQLTQLTDVQKNDLARLVAERGVVFFRDQNMDVHEQIAFGAYFGELHIHQMAGIIPDLPWVHPIHKDETAVNGRSHQIWHSDVSYELQPPGLTMLKMDTLPRAGPGGEETGGDTIWASGYALYECEFSSLSIKWEMGGRSRDKGLGIC